MFDLQVLQDTWTAHPYLVAIGLVYAVAILIRWDNTLLITRWGNLEHVFPGYIVIYHLHAFYKPLAIAN